MNLRIIKYEKPEKLEIAYSLLQQQGASVIAGGAWLKLLPKTIETAVDLSKLGLDFIRETDHQVEIGAMSTLRFVECSKEVQALGDGILSDAIHGIMGVTLRNIATIGGSVFGKFGFSDLLTPLLVLDAEVVCYQHGAMSLENFLNEKIRQDIVTQINIPKKQINGYYRSVKKTANDFPVLNIAISKEGNKCRIAVGARPGVARLAKETATYINQLEVVNEASLEACSAVLLEELKFSNNLRASKTYREDLAAVLVQRGLKEVGYDY
jgi:CO/xanthine dehydrogenase FAD-binding subunit